MRLVLKASLCVLSLNSVAFSCGCLWSVGCQVLGGKAAPVFLGTVLAVTDLASTGDEAFLTHRRARIQVNESFGGLPPDVHQVDVLTGAGGGDCGFPFKAGEAYLVQAFVKKDGLLHVSTCSSTRRIDAAGVALRILRQLRDGQQVPSLAGQIAQRDRNFVGDLGAHDPKPLGNVLVRVKGDGRVYETRADPEGLYAFYNLPSGRYHFAPDIPPGTTLASYIGSDGPLLPFELRAGVCEERNVEVVANGSIQGRIFDSSNMLLPHASVYIVPADEKVIQKKRQLYRESQGEEGFFRFVHVPPGKYLILVNPDDSLDPEFPYPRTFYPGVHDRESAAIITIRGGEQIKDADIRLEQQFAPRHLTARVTWADGRLIKDSVFIEARGIDKPAAMFHTSQPDPKASVVDLSVVPNEAYEVKAELICQYADARSMGAGATLKSNKVYLGRGDSRTELFLKIPATACPKIPGRTLLTEQ